MRSGSPPPAPAPRSERRRAGDALPDAPKVLSADLVVVGGGGAGLCAAAAALEAGVADVMMLEKAPTLGGNTSQSAGLFAVESPAQARLGIHSSSEAAFQEKMSFANWRVDPVLTRRCIEMSGWLVGWLESRGMRFDNVIEFVREGAAPKVFHSFSPGASGFIGQKVVDSLAGECLGRGLRVLPATAATGLTTDGRGQVDGVSACDADGELLVRAGCVILATGGFGGSHILMERHFPGHGEVFTLSRPEITGDGLVMAQEAGAVLDGNMVLVVTGPHHYPWSHVLTLLVRRPDILVVNKLGERYSDETVFLDNHTQAGNALSRQPDMTCWGILDDSLVERMISGREIIGGMEREAGGSGAWLAELRDELQAGVDRGTVVRSDSLEGLAGGIGVSPDSLAGTLARYNAHCERGHDDEFFKEARFLRPIRTSPYYAVLGRQGFDTTLGGIKVDHRMEVIASGDTPIPGLFAAGDCASGWEHADYNLHHPGSAMTFALCSGLIAGREAARFLAGGE